MRAEGIGIRSVAQLASSAFLSSSAGTAHLVEQILPENLKGTFAPKVQPLEEWSKLSDAPPQSFPANHQQRAWDSRQVESIYSKLVEAAPTPRNRARLLAATTKESISLLIAPPSISLGLRLLDEGVRIAIGFRLVHLFLFLTSVDCVDWMLMPLPHMDGAASRAKAGTANMLPSTIIIVKCSLAATQIPSILQPNGLCRNDGKRPVGVTIIPLCGMPYVLTLATSNIHHTVRGAKGG